MRSSADMYVNSDWLGQIDPDFAAILTGTESRPSAQSGPGCNPGVGFMNSLIQALPWLLGRGTDLLVYCAT
jgi:hypothetical protein